MNTHAIEPMADQPIKATQIDHDGRSPVTSDVARPAARRRNPVGAANRAALSFFEAATRVQSIGELTSSFAAVAEASGFTMVSCVHIASPGQPVALRNLFGWNLGDWAAQYMRERLSRYDPTIRAVFTSPSAFTWSDIEERTADKAGLRIFEMARSFGARSGLVVPVHGPLGEVMAVTMISPYDRAIDPQERMNMQVAATIFASRGLAFSEVDQQPIGDPRLSRREIQCVYWVNEGKTDWEIGRILGVSEDTVAFHLKNVKTKLKVTRRAQIPTAAWLRGVLLDESP